MYKVLLSLRYLRTRFIALASIISVMLGVATMIVVNSVMSGFGEEMRDRLHNLLADINVTTVSMNGVPDAQRWMDMIEKIGGDNIEGMTASVEVYGMMTFEYSGQPITRPVTLVGIEPRGKSQVGPLIDYLESFQSGLRSEDDIEAWLKNPWEPTQEAREYIKNWVYNNPWDTAQSWEPDAADSPATETSGDDKPAFATSDEPPPFANPESTDATADPLATEPGTKKELTDPFAQLQQPAKPNTIEETLHRGRAYVGHGLISYQYTDPKTGKVESRMMVQPGDSVRMSTVSTSLPPEPRSLAVTIVDVLKTGMSEYDSNLVFCNLDYLQEMRGMVDPATGARDFTTIQIKLKDYDKAPELVAALRESFPPGMFVVQTWEDKQGPLLAAVEMESAILNVLLFLIIAVAGFGILAIFYMIVVEKTRDIGIMKALGASAAGIMSIFLSYGLALGIVGSGVGVMLGLIFVSYINEIEDFLSMLTGRPVFDEQIYYFSEIPTMVSPLMVFWVACGAITIAVLASILPARRAARMHPVESLRYE